MAVVSNISKRRKNAQADGSQDYATKREEIVRIAARLFKERGYQSTRLVDIAKEAGVDRATIYYYVGSKEELFRDTIVGVLDTNIAEADRLINDATITWLEKLHGIYIFLMDSYEANYPATFVYIQEQMHQVQGEESAWAQSILEKTKSFDNSLMAFIKGAIATGELRSDVPARLVENALFGMLNWTHRWFVPGGPMTGKEIAEAFWSIFIGGMRPDARSRAT